MNYKLARQLKEAGFPQKITKEASLAYHYSSQFEGSDLEGEVITPLGSPLMESGAYIKIPTLEELIEACEDGYFSLHNHSGSIVWCATWNDSFCSPMDKQKVHGHGKTSTIAVANLWLKLNKK